jgi:hypothetical protein
MSIREQILSKKGTFATVTSTRPCKVRKGSPVVTKTTKYRNVRLGCSYDSLARTKAEKGVTTTAEARALNKGLNGMVYAKESDYPYIKTSVKTGKQYAVLTLNKNSKFDTVYTLNGKEVSKAEVEPYLLASEKSKGEMPSVLNIGLDTITKFS